MTDVLNRHDAVGMCGYSTVVQDPNGCPCIRCTSYLYYSSGVNLTIMKSNCCLCRFRYQCNNGLYCIPSPLFGCCRVVCLQQEMIRVNGNNWPIAFSSLPLAATTFACLRCLPLFYQPVPLPFRPSIFSKHNIRNFPKIFSKYK